MKWILLVPNKSIEGIERITAFITEHTKHVEVIVFSEKSKTDIKKTIETLEQASHAIVFYTNEINTPLFNYCIGFLAGKNTPALLYSAEDIFPPTLEFCVSFSSSDTLLTALEKNITYYISEDEKNRSRQKLIDEGLAFTSEVFAMYITRGNESMCSLFLNAGIDVNERDLEGTPMLNLAVRHGKQKVVQLLLDRGANINATSQDRGYSAIMDAVWKNNAEIATLLIENGADLNGIATDGQSLFVLAVGGGNEEICEILASHGADPFVKDKMGMSAFDYAKLFSKTKILETIGEYSK